MDTDKGIVLIHSLGRLQAEVATLILDNMVRLVTNQDGVVNIRARMIEGSSISNWYTKKLDELSKGDPHVKFLIKRNVEVYPNDVDREECESNTAFRDDYVFGSHKLQLAGGRMWTEGVHDGTVDSLYQYFMAIKRAMTGSVDINAATRLVVFGSPILFDKNDVLVRSYMSTTWRYIDDFGVDSYEFVDTSPLGLIRRGVASAVVFGGSISRGNRNSSSRRKGNSMADILLSIN